MDMADLLTKNPIPVTTYTFFSSPTSSSLSKPITVQQISQTQTQPQASTFVSQSSLIQSWSTTGIVIDTPSKSPPPALGPPLPPQKEPPKFSPPNIAGISLAAVIFAFLVGFLIAFCVRERRLKRKRISSTTSIPTNYPLNLTGGGPDWRRVNWPEDRKRKRGQGVADELEDGGSDGIREIMDPPLWGTSLQPPHRSIVRSPTPVKLRAPHNSFSGPSYTGASGDERRKESEAMKGIIKESVALAEKPLIRRPSDGIRSMHGSMRLNSEDKSRELSQSREGMRRQDDASEKKEKFPMKENYRDLESEKAEFRRQEEARSGQEKEREKRERQELARIHGDVVTEEARARQEAHNKFNIEASRLRSRFQSLLHQEIPHPIQPPVPEFAPPPRCIPEPTTAELVARQQAQRPPLAYGYQSAQRRPLAHQPRPAPQPAQSRPKPPRTPVTPSLRPETPREMAEKPAKPRSQVSWADNVGWVGPRVTWDAKKQELVPQESPLRTDRSPVNQKDQSPANYFPSVAKEQSPLKLFPSPMRPRRQGSKDNISASPLNRRPSQESPLKRQLEMGDVSRGPVWMAEPLVRKPSREDGLKQTIPATETDNEKESGKEGVSNTNEDGKVAQESLGTWWRDSIPLAQVGATTQRSSSAPMEMVGRCKPGTSWFDFEDSP